MKKQLLIAGIMALVLVAGGCGTGPGVEGETGEKPSGTAVETANPESGSIKETTFVTGSIKSAGEYDILTGGTGTVQSIAVKTGAKVKAGQVLFSLDANSIRDAMDLKTAQIDSEIKLYAMQLDDKQRNYDRVKTLVDSGVSSKSELESATLALDQARVNLQNAENNRALTAKDYQRQLSDRVISSPINGTVAAIYINVGQEVGSMTAMKIVDGNGMIFTADVPQNVLRQMKVGQKVDAYPDGNREAAVEGVVTTMDTAPVTGSNLYTVEATLKHADNLTSGMYAEAEIVLQQKEKVLLIDRNILVTQNDVTGCFIVQDGKAAFVPLTLGMKEGGKIEVIEGIKPDSAVVVKGQSYLQDGDAVNVVQP